MSEREKKIQEGVVKKGGQNPKPSTQRPSKPPQGQSPKKGGNKK
jgi:hypothetical protein